LPAKSANTSRRKVTKQKITGATRIMMRSLLMAAMVEMEVLFKVKCRLSVISCACWSGEFVVRAFESGVARISARIFLSKVEKPPSYPSTGLCHKRDGR
jgi:hypothetical protein